MSAVQQTHVWSTAAAFRQSAANGQGQSGEC